MHTSLSLHFIDVQCLDIFFGHYLPILRKHYTDAELVTIGCSCRCGLVLWFFVVLQFYTNVAISALQQLLPRESFPFPRS
jgi:hypothetical protein